MQEQQAAVCKGLNHRKLKGKTLTFFTLLIHDGLDIRQQLRSMVHLVNENRGREPLKEQIRILLSQDSQFKFVQRNISPVRVAIPKNGCLAHLAWASHGPAIPTNIIFNIKLVNIFPYFWVFC